MAVELSALVYRATDRYVIARRNAQLRRSERKIVQGHPEWTPLTKSELAGLDRRDRFSYIFYRNMVGPEDLRWYLPVAPYTTRLLPMLNPLNHRANSFGVNTEFSDKSCAGQIMSGMAFPATILYRTGGEFYAPDRRHITADEALALLRPYDEAVFKQSVGGYHGHGIRLVRAEEYAGVLLTHGPDYLVQERVRQHADLARFNPTSVNIVRVTTLLWQGELYILGGILRVGAPGAFCDHENRDGKTYLSIPLTEDGDILPRACDVDYGHVYGDCHGVALGGRFPAYDRIRALVLREHGRWPQYGIIGWDITVDEAGQVVCMEFNTKYPGLVGTQAALGPVLARPGQTGRPLLEEMTEKAERMR